MSMPSADEVEWLRAKLRQAVDLMVNVPEGSTQRHKDWDQSAGAWLLEVTREMR
jgi:hypothetical protein